MLERPTSKGIWESVFLNNFPWTCTCTYNNHFCPCEMALSNTPHPLIGNYSSHILYAVGSEISVLSSSTIFIFYFKACKIISNFKGLSARTENHNVQNFNCIIAIRVSVTSSPIKFNYISYAELSRNIRSC